MCGCVYFRACSDSVDELMSMPDIDGCLVGGASLDPNKFARIMNFKVTADR
jgi:triosephosphate isomerase